MTKTKLWSLLALVVGVFAMAVVAGCGSSDDTSSDGTASDGTVASADLPLLKPGTLTVGSDIPYPPFEQGDPPDYEGFDIDLINAIADKMGLETSIQDKPFNLLLSGGGGQIDLAIAATTITAERAKKVDFTDPYYNASQGLLVPSGSDIQSVDDLAGKIVGAQDGTTGETYANDNTDAAEVRPFPQTDDAYNALKTGQVDAVLNDLTVGPGRGEAARRARGRAGLPDRRAVRDVRAEGLADHRGAQRGAAAGQGRRHADRPVPAVLQDRSARGAAAARARRRARAVATRRPAAERAARQTARRKRAPDRAPSSR